MGNTGKPPAVLSLCSGYGGLEIGLERVFGKVNVLAHVEIEAFAIANLVNKMETGRMVPTPIWTDLKTFKPGLFRGIVDILTGGYPCQPFSAAGKRRGSEDPRHLWPFVRETIHACQPGWVFLENVEGHISKGLTEVLSDLEKMAYTPVTGVFSAAEVGAPHQRKRVFILAYATSGEPRKSKTWNWRESLRGRSQELAEPIKQGSQGRPEEQVNERGVQLPIRRSNHYIQWPARPGEPQYEWEEPRVCRKEVMDDTCGSRGERSSGDASESSSYRKNNRLPSSTGKHYVPQTQPQLGRAPNGTTDRVDRLRLLGNGVVPQTAEIAFRTLYYEYITARTSSSR